MVLSLTTLLLTAAATAPMAQGGGSAQAEAPRSVLAMTKDGIRLEVSVKPAVGDSAVMTEFGRYFTPLDPVAVVLKVPKRDLWRNELAGDPSMSLLPVIGAANGDGRILDLIDLTATLEELWLKTEDDKLKRQRAKEMVAASKAIWRWGQRLDPVPSKLDQDERVEWLWKRMLKAPGAGALLAGGRLMEEVVQAQGGFGDRQIKMVELSRALRDDNPYIGHAAARIAGFQHVSDVGMGANLLGRSVLEPHPILREGCAIGITKLYPDHARMYWADTLFGGEDEHRIIAAWHLVDHLPKQADGPLVATLASMTTTVSRKITVGGLTIRVEDRRRPAQMPLRPNSQITLLGPATTSGGDP